MLASKGVLINPTVRHSMITLSDAVLDDLKTFRGRNAARYIRVENGASG